MLKLGLLLSSGEGQIYEQIFLKITIYNCFHGDMLKILRKHCRHSIQLYYKVFTEELAFWLHLEGGTAVCLVKGFSGKVNNIYKMAGETKCDQTIR